MKKSIGIGSAVGALLYLLVNLFLPSGISIFSLANSGLDAIVSNFPIIILTAIICEFVGIAIGFVITKVVDLT